MEQNNNTVANITTGTETATATATVQQQDVAPKESLLLEYGVDIFLVICFVIVYFIKPDPNLSLEKQKEKNEEEPNELEKVLVTEPDESKTQQKENSSEKTE